jgi:hypothetical protein
MSTRNIERLHRLIDRSRAGKRGIGCLLSTGADQSMYKIIGNTQLRAMRLDKLLRTIGSTEPADRLKLLRPGQSERVALGADASIRVVRV